MTAVKNSLITATVGSTVAVLMGVVVSYVVYRTKVVGRGVLDFIAMLPVAVPGVAVGMALLVAWISTPIYGTLGIIMLAYVTRWLPVGQKSIAAVFLSLGSELEESARVSGASWFKMMRDVVMPLLKPGIIGAWMVLFVVFIRELSASVLLYKTGTEVMSVAMWQLMQVDVATSCAFMVFQTTMLLCLVAFMEKVTGQSAAKSF